MNTGHLRRRVALIMLLAASVPVTVALLSRPTKKPASLTEGYRACLVEPAAIVRSAGGRADVGPGAASVLLVYAAWGTSPFRAGSTSGELLLELPRGPHAGDMFRFAGGTPAGLYRERSDGIHYISDTLEGTVEVASQSPQVVVFSIALHPRSPSINLSPTAGAPLKGTVRARRVARPQDCSSL